MPDAQFQRIAADQPPLADEPEMRRQLARLVIAAVPAFYDLIPLPVEALEDVIGNQIGTSGTELEQAAMASFGGSPAALVTWLACDRLDAARRAGSVGLMRQIDRASTPAFLKAVGDYSKSVEPFTGEGLYLSRVAVADAQRGQGLGRAAVQQVIDAGVGSDVWLHVAAGNEPAIALYRSMGFQFAANGDFQSRAMRRPGHVG